MATPVSFAVANIDNVLADVYVVPASTASIVVSLFICNKSAGALLIDVVLVKASGAVTVFICDAVNLEASQTLIPIGDNMRLCLMAGDKIQVRATTGTNVLDVCGGALEQAV